MDVSKANDTVLGDEVKKHGGIVKWCKAMRE